MTDYMLEIARFIFRKSVNIIFSNDAMSIKQLHFSDRQQLVWIGEHVGRKIALRIFERKEAKFFQQYIKAGDVCLDVGANMGFFTHLFAARVGRDGIVIAVEPIEKNTRLIELSSILNNTQDMVKVFCLAASDQENQIIDFVVNTDSSVSHVAESTKVKRGGVGVDLPHTKIKATTLDSIIEKCCVERVDIVKMDIEGFEYFALKGMHAILSNPARRPRLLALELVSTYLSSFGTSIDQVLEFLQTFGYRATVLDNNMSLIPYKSKHRDRVQNVFFINDQYTNS